MKIFTKYYTYFLLILFSASCSKNQDAKKTIRISIVEYKTNLPVVDALVEYYKLCPTCTPAPGYNLVFSARSGNGGNCEIPESIFNNVQYGILISPPPPPQIQPPSDFSYLQTGNPGIHSSEKNFSLTVTGDEKLHLIKINDYPTGYYMDIKALGEQSYFQTIDIARVYAFPSDTSFDFYAYRGQTNTIYWNIYDSKDSIISSGGPLKADFPKTGIQYLELKY